MRRFLARSLSAGRRQAPTLVRTGTGSPCAVVRAQPAHFSRWFSSPATSSGDDVDGEQAGTPPRRAADPTAALSNFEGTKPEWIVVDGKVISRRKFVLEPLNDGDESSEVEVAWHPSQAVLDESFYSQHDKNRLSVRRAMEMFQEGSDADTGKSEVQVAALTARINYLTPHFQKHRKDKSGIRGLQRIISQRTKLLKYIRRDSVERYEECIEALGIRDQLSSPPSKYLKTQGWNSPVHTATKRKRRFKKKIKPLMKKKT